jgi:hypothetical protein
MRVHFDRKFEREGEGGLSYLTRGPVALIHRSGSRAGDSRLSTVGNQRDGLGSRRQAAEGNPAGYPLEAKNLRPRSKLRPFLPRLVARPTMIDGRKCESKPSVCHPRISRGGSPLACTSNGGSRRPVHFFTTERTLSFVELHVRHTGVGPESPIPPSMFDGRNVGSGDFLTRFFL